MGRAPTRTARASASRGGSDEKSGWTGGRIRKWADITIRPSAYPLIRLLRFLLGLGGRDEADHLDSGTAGDVHRFDHVLVGAVGPGLDEHELRGTLVINAMQLGIQSGLGDRLGVDGIRAVVLQLEHDLVALGRPP